jgi:Ca-activated chloride channel family protein
MYPAFFWLLPVVLIPFGFSYWREKRLLGITFTRVPLMLQIMRTPGQYGRYSLVVLRSFAWLCLILALARPWTPAAGMPDQGRVLDVLLLLDVSKSMQAEDIAPNRLAAAKIFLEEFIQKHTDARFGLVIFAGRSLSLVPLTNDHEMFLDTLRAVTIQDSPGAGTAIGDALRLAQQRLEFHTPGLPDFQPGPSQTPRALLLLTDGANHTGMDPLPIVRELGQRGIEVCVVGVGRVQPTVRLAYNEISGKRQPVLDPYGQIQNWETLDERGLQQLAQSHGRGLFLRLDHPNAFNALKHALAQWEADTGRRSSAGPPRDLFWIPLLAAFVCMGLEFLLGTIYFRRLFSV